MHASVYAFAIVGSRVDFPSYQWSSVTVETTEQGKLESGCRVGDADGLNQEEVLRKIKRGRGGKRGKTEEETDRWEGVRGQRMKSRKRGVNERGREAYGWMRGLRWKEGVEAGWIDLRKR